MGRIKSRSMLGRISGKVGNVVLSSWKDQEVIRELGVRRSTNITFNQQVQRAKFAMGGSFIKKLKKILPITYKLPDMTGHNAAMAYLMENAITGAYPNFGIDYSKVQIAGGSLGEVVTPAAISNAPGVIHFSWMDNSDDDIKMSDKALVVAYCESLQKVVYKFGIAERSDIAADLQVAAFSGLPVHTWIAFLSEDQTEASQSEYAGLVNVQ